MFSRGGILRVYEMQSVIEGRSLPCHYWQVLNLRQSHVVVTCSIIL
jgi:hypothetical protein